ncbi:MAG: ATP-binding protein [Candidatus Pacebacteria bacterium]|nr:ATP-binding protein [Candidatus Paceibacterota bacterium]NUQ42674.1 ATP-binding protein [Calditrichaceae bacterium]
MSNSIASTKQIGIILSGGTTSETAFQPLENYENHLVEGKLVVVFCQRIKTEILGRISRIIPYNAFYSEGDAFSEARRKGMTIPGDIAKQYQVCKVDLLQTLDKGPASSVTFPPHPGDPVYLYDHSLHEIKLFGMKRDEGDEKHIWFGTQVGYPDAPIALNIENMPMHMAVFGVTGSGKSYNMGSLIECLSSIPFKKDDKKRVYVPYPMIIIDANGDYSDYSEVNDNEEIGSYGKQTIERIFFPNSYEREQLRGTIKKNLQRLVINLDVLNTRDLSEMIMEFYRGDAEGVSALQVSGLQRHIDNLAETMGFSKQDLFTTQFNTLRDAINQDRDIHQQTRPAIVRALDEFHRRMEVENHLLSDRSSEWFNIDIQIDRLTKGGIAIFDFSADGATGIDLPIKQFVIGYLSAMLFNKFTRYKQSEEGARYLSFVIEEAQNFCPGRRYPIGSSLAKTKLSAIATQGRKFGLSLCLISQRPSFVDEIILSMCNTFFLHRISPEDLHFVKSVTGGLPESLSRRLTTLSQGECIITGQMNRLPFALLIKGLERKVKHTAGKTDVVSRIVHIRGL